MLHNMRCHDPAVDRDLWGAAPWALHVALWRRSPIGSMPIWHPSCHIVLVACASANRELPMPSETHERQPTFQQQVLKHTCAVLKNRPHRRGL